MEAYKRGSYTVWDCKYHPVWVTKHRYMVLGGDVGSRCRELLRETARAHEIVVHAGSISRDHVHMLVSIPPNLSVSRAVQHLKGCSSHKPLSEFVDLAAICVSQELSCSKWLVTSLSPGGARECRDILCRGAGMSGRFSRCFDKIDKRP